MALVPPALILLVFAASAARDNDANCAHWAEIGECDKNPKFMQKECAKSCSMIERDTADQAECSRLVKEGRCHADVALVRCRASCYTALKANLTEDLEGNCFYWATDGECESNREWMATSCRRSCELLRSCGVAPESKPCARSFECPLARDRDDADKCAAAARRGECRARDSWTGQVMLERCPYSCAILDPASASKTVTRPMMKRAPHMDARVRRHQPSRCHHIGLRHPLLGAQCPNVPPSALPNLNSQPRLGSADGVPELPYDDAVDERYTGADLDPVPWRRRWRRCPRVASAHQRLTPRLLHDVLPDVPLSALPSKAAKLTSAPGTAPGRPSEADLRPVRVQMISESPRVRVLHNFVTEYEAQRLIELAGPHFHRSSTARAGADDKRTSNSATLASGDPVVSAVRHRIAFYCGYPEPNLEPLQVCLHADDL